MPPIHKYFLKFQQKFLLLKYLFFFRLLGISIVKFLLCYSLL